MSEITRSTEESAYRNFIERLNNSDLQGAARYVDIAAYRENCVGFTRGEVGWQEATAELTRVWRGLPDLHVELDVVATSQSDDGLVLVIAHGQVTGTATGRLYGAPATGRAYRASFFDLVRIREGLIIQRIQQSDVLGQTKQLYGTVLGAIGVGAMLRRLQP